MRATNMKNTNSMTRLFLAPMVAVVRLLLTGTAFAATPGITGPTFNLTAQPAFITQPDGSLVYSWGYGCTSAPSGFAPASIAGGTCANMQAPGPTLIVQQGQPVSVTLPNHLPVAAGNTSSPFPAFIFTH